MFNRAYVMAVRNIRESSESKKGNDANTDLITPSVAIGTNIPPFSNCFPFTEKLRRKGLQGRVFSVILLIGQIPMNLH